MATHTIAAGETLWALSQRYRCTVDDLLRLNPGIQPTNLQIGQVIRLADESRPSSTSGRLDLRLNGEAPPPIAQFRPWIDRAAEATGVPADLLGAVIFQESSGNLDVNSTVNPGGMGLDSGVMQVNEQTAKELEQKFPGRFVGLDRLGREILLGASYLKEMFDTVADHRWDVALRAYNSGPYGINKDNLRDRPLGTGDATYVDKVLHFWSDISRGHPLPPDHYESIYGRGF